MRSKTFATILAAVILATASTLPQSGPAQAASSGSQAIPEVSAKLKTEAVVPLTRAVAGARDLSGFGYTYRHNWGFWNGQRIFTLTSSNYTRNTRAFVAIGECDPAGGKIIGAARYTVHNVAPTNGAVRIWVNIEWSAPIGLCADYLIVNP